MCRGVLPEWPTHLSLQLLETPASYNSCASHWAWAPAVLNCLCQCYIPSTGNTHSQSQAKAGVPSHTVTIWATLNIHPRCRSPWRTSGNHPADQLVPRHTCRCTSPHLKDNSSSVLHSPSESVFRAPNVNTWIKGNTIPSPESTKAGRGYRCCWKGGEGFLLSIKISELLLNS